MINTRYYLDTRDSETGTLKIVIATHHKSAMISTGVKLSKKNWDATNSIIVGLPQQQCKAMNLLIQAKKAQIDRALLHMETIGEASTDITKLKNDVLILIGDRKTAKARNLFADRYRTFANKKNSGSKGIYLNTLRRLMEFDANLNERTFEEITPQYLERFSGFLSITECTNTIAISMRCIRAVFNDALDDELITCYPFRKYKIKTTETAKRSLTASEMHRLINCECTAAERYFLDMFLLSFYLIGINTKDLYYLEEIDNHGRIEYNRAKTGRHYSILVPPEALAIIKAHRGTKYLVDIADRFSDHRTFISKCNKVLKQIGGTTYEPVKTSTGTKYKKVVRPMFPNLSTYFCRHTWATLAAELDTPKETIAAALGHSSGSVTDIYIRFDYKKVDAANRAVIDSVINAK